MPTARPSAVYRALFTPELLGTGPIDVIAMSHPSTCGVTSTHIDGIPDELLARFLEANTDAGPLRLHGIEGVVDIVEWQANLRHYREPFVVRNKIGERHLVTLSRVGVSRDGTSALMCARGNHSPENLFHFMWKDERWILHAAIQP